MVHAGAWLSANAYATSTGGEWRLTDELRGVYSSLPARAHIIHLTAQGRRGRAGIASAASAHAPPPPGELPRHRQHGRATTEGRRRAAHRVAAPASMKAPRHSVQQVEWQVALERHVEGRKQ